jgi:hypothetical protein
VAYRDRRGDEVRDISVAWLAAGGWSEPAPVDPDGWRIEGCPVNGPAIDRCKGRLALAWFTMARDTARVKLAFSDDAGLEFGPAVRVDAGDPLGRVGVVLLEDGSALVSWLEVRGPGGLFQVRAIGRKGELGKVTTVAQTSAARASGVPRMARKGYRVLFAWTEASDPSQIRVAIGRIAH